MDVQQEEVAGEHARIELCTRGEPGCLPPADKASSWYTHSRGWWIRTSITAPGIVKFLYGGFLPFMYSKILLPFFSHVTWKRNQRKRERELKQFRYICRCIAFNSHQRRRLRGGWSRGGVKSPIQMGRRGNRRRARKMRKLNNCDNATSSF